ncbi:MAG: hypothetical protein ACFFDN_20575, partial [Candidatus Hodarchaeota archaeon]
LLKVAKTGRAEAMANDSSEFEKGSINFMTISNSSSLLYDDYYNKNLRNEEGAEIFIRTHRPYSPEKLTKLLNIGNDLTKDFPKSKLELLGEALFYNKFSSILKSLFIYTRSIHNKKQKKVLDNLFKFDSNLIYNYPPWQFEPNSKTYKTAILDILDIYRFLGV